MKRIKVYGGFKSGKTRKLIDYLTSYIVNGKKCLFVSLGDSSAYDFYKLIKSSLPSEVDFKDVSHNIDYIIQSARTIRLTDLISKLENRLDYDAIFIDPVNNLIDYGIYDPTMYSELRRLSDYLNADLYVSVCKFGSELGITDF